MKKILVITFEFPPVVGGIASYLHGMLAMLPSNSVVVLAPIHSDAKKHDETLPYKVVRKPLLYPRFLWPRWLRLLFHVWRIVREEKIQLIMVHHVLPVGIVAYVTRKFFHIPYIVFFHGTDVTLASRSAWKRGLVERIGREAEHLFFTSEWLRSRFVDVYPSLEKKSTGLSPCPSPIFFERPPAEDMSLLKERYALEGKKVILSVGRFVTGKGFRGLIHLLPLVLQDVPNAVCVIVGSGPQRGDLVALVQKSHLQNSVRFVGEIPQEQLPLFFGFADVFVLLTHPQSGAEEALGMAFLEASAAGIPVIGGISGGVREAVLDGKTGLLLNAHQEKDVVNAIVRILRDPVYAKKLGDAGREFVAREYRWADRLAELRPYLDT